MQKKDIIKYITITTVSMIAGLALFLGGYYFVLFAIWDYDPNFLKADKCLDYGGVWDSEGQKCWYAGECEDSGGIWSAAESRCITK